MISIHLYCPFDVVYSKRFAENMIAMYPVNHPHSSSCSLQSKSYKFLHSIRCICLLYVSINIRPNIDLIRTNKLDLTKFGCPFIFRMGFLKIFFLQHAQKIKGFFFFKNCINQRLIMTNRTTPLSVINGRPLRPPQVNKYIISPL